MADPAAQADDDPAMAPTVTQPPSEPLDGGVSSSDPVSPVAALRLEEIERSRVFFQVVLALATGGVMFALASDGDGAAKLAVIAGSALSVASAIYALAFVLDPDTYQPRRLVAPGVPVMIGTLLGVYYWGTISPVTGMLVYGIYFFGLGVDGRFVTAIYVTLATGHAAIAGAVASGVLADRGIMRLASLEPINQIVVLTLVEGLYLLAFLTARRSQQATLRAVSRLEQAVRAVAHRDALLAEARAELERVRDVGGPGRFSELVVGAYRLGMVIGRGGIGEVYEAQHVSTRAPAAVKLLRSDALGDDVQVQRLLREAEAASRIQSRNVVHVLDVGTTAAGVPFIVMERMHGFDLAHELRARRRLALADTLKIVEDIAAGLDAAHEVGIVHRDLKPHNVFGATAVDGARVWKIVDFGVSKLGPTGTLTAGHVIGTPSYMSPEQARAEDVDHRTDVYALAAIVFRAVTGYAAFSGRDVATTLYEVVHRAPPRPSSLAELPRDVDRVLAIGLAKTKDDRFDTAIELARWFEAAIDDALTAAQRARADALIARAPWGTPRAGT